MKKVIFIFTLAVLSLLMVSCALKVKQSSIPQDAQKEIDSRSIALANALTNGNFNDATKDFDDKMLAALPPQKLEESWKSVTSSIGAYKSVYSVASTGSNGSYIMNVKLKFENNGLNVKITYDKDYKICGLWFNYVDLNNAAPSLPSGVTEEKVTVGDKWRLDGRITMPKSGKNLPLVILVQGSGVHDMDETVYTNKPFQDIAYGLAQKGIAVLRYDKRTYTYGNEMGQKSDFTVKDETLDDVIYAIQTAKKESRIDSNKIYILGHSLGGMLIPRLDSMTKDAAGYIMMAGSVRTLDQIIIDQNNYLLDKQNLNAEQKAPYEQQLKAEADKLTALMNGEKVTDKIYGMSACYMKDLNSFNAYDQAKKMTKPILVMRGESDFQIYQKDFDLTREAFSGNSKAVFKSYPGLNHLFMEYKGGDPSVEGTVNEYSYPAHVSQNAIDDIGDFVLKK
ncbi:MAG: alpha/beta fold hydrolase [Bacillota bacterium]|nr:alpha/beta fold hydrolase [Bacillota bacterium]